MRLGLTLPSPATSLGAVIDTAVEAERAGFDTLYVSEGHFARSAGFANPYAVAAAISGTLQHAWLGVRPALGIQHPLETVEQCNLLDVLTRGRSLMVISNDADPGQYASFGLPTPANDLFEQLVGELDRAWSWHFVEDGPPFELAAGAHSSRMAGRIMPAPCRQPHPLLARETDAETTALDAARRGWPVQLRGPDAHALAHTYRDVLSRANHPQATVDECLRWLVLVLRVSSDTDLSVGLRACEEAGAAEVRLDPAEGLSPGTLVQMKGSGWKG